jgi:transcriptional regulator with PAS, ATPase and Fis domain
VRTPRDLRSECEHGRFRQDLLYRLDVIRIRIPPLRERPEDIPSLTQHFWAVASARVGTKAVLSHGVLAALVRYHWPGNVRELQNVLSGLAVAASARGQVRAALLPAVVTGATPITAGRLSTARSQWERRFVEVAMARAGGSRSRAARELGLSRQGLLKVLERLRLS